MAVVARGIAEHGNAFGHWAAILDSIDPDDLAAFEDAYLGHWPTVEAYAEELVEGIGLFNEDDLPDAVRATSISTTRGSPETWRCPATSRPAKETEVSTSSRAIGEPIPALWNGQRRGAFTHPSW